MELGQHPEKVDVVWPTVDSSPSLMLTGPTGRDSRSPGAGMALAGPWPGQWVDWSMPPMSEAEVENIQCVRKLRSDP